MRFVLVHGSWHDGSCWDEVAAHLRAAGHEVHTPTLPGNGRGARRDVTLEQTWRGVADVLVAEDLRDVILVGHSLGGVIVQLAALAVPERLRRLVFHNAYVAEHGRTLFEHLPPSAAEAFGGLAAADGTLSLPFEFARDALLGEADLATAKDVFARLSPEPLGRTTEPIDVAGFAELPVPRSYVHAVDDNVFPAHEFTWHPGQSRRLGAFRLVQLPGGHEVLFTAPAALAAKLIEAGRD